jgi:DNA-binding YbaB/EbfC family protein
MALQDDFGTVTTEARREASDFCHTGTDEKNRTGFLEISRLILYREIYLRKEVAEMKMDKMLKQVQKMQAQMTLAQEALNDETVEGSSGGGMVTAKANGHGDIVSISISKEVVDPDDVEMLEDLVLSAVRESIRLSRELAEKRLGSITGGLNIPGLF